MYSGITQMFWEILIGQRADKPIKKNSAVLLLAFITHVAKLIFPPYPNRVFPSSIHPWGGWLDGGHLHHLQGKCGCPTFAQGLTRGMTQGWIEPTTTCKVRWSWAHHIAWAIGLMLLVHFFPFSNAFFGKKAWSCILVHTQRILNIRRLKLQAHPHRLFLL